MIMYDQYDTGHNDYVWQYDRGHSDYVWQYNQYDTGHNDYVWQYNQYDTGHNDYIWQYNQDDTGHNDYFLPSWLKENVEEGRELVKWLCVTLVTITLTILAEGAVEEEGYKETQGTGGVTHFTTLATEPSILSLKQNAAGFVVNTKLLTY